MISRLIHFARRRSLGIALVACCAAVGFTVLATASDSRAPRRTTNSSELNRTSLGLFVKTLRAKEPLAAAALIRSAQAAKQSASRSTSSPPAPSPAPMPPAIPGGRSTADPSDTRILAAAADWPFSYTLNLKRKLSSLDETFRSVMPISLVRRNMLTGERKVLIRIRRAIPWKVQAGGGRVMISMLDSISSRTNASRIIAFEPGSPKPVTIATDNFSISGEESRGELCGRFSSLSGVGPSGEALITRITALCTTDRQRDYDLETVSIARDGATRVLDPAPGIGAITLGKAQLAGDHLLLSGPFAGTINAVNTSNGIKTRLWEVEGSNSASIASDGSVVIGPGFGSDFEDDYPYYYDTRQGPFVRIPQSDADNPSVIADANYKTIAMRYCGQKLYELRLPHFVYPSSTADGLSMLDGLPVISSFDVIVRDVSGGTPQQIATTGEIWVRSIGCDGEALLLTTDRRTSADVLRFGS